MADSAVQTTELRRIVDSCLNLDKPKSFFLFAGAGSGKTRALVDAMKMFRKKYGQEFRLSARKVAVITYTNAACDEIKHRIDYDSIFAVSTIHSFAWTLIGAYHEDIRGWIRQSLTTEIQDLTAQQLKGRAGTQAALDRTVKLESKRRRQERLSEIKYFTYNPNGENLGKNSLNHAEVIGIAADFLMNKPLMQRILIRKYPVLLIDESQDTQKDLIDAFFAVQNKNSDDFCLALFGDTMQQIYSDGKIDLEKAVPPEWERPAITINHRSPKRIVRLINAIRKGGADTREQQPREDAAEGFVRLFVVQDHDGINKTSVETEIANQMGKITSDEKWTGDSQEIKTLILEHRMAARRGGFSNFFDPLYQNIKLKDGLLKGTLSGIPLFSQQVLPLVKSLQAKDRFAIAQIVKKYSPLVSAATLKACKSSLEEIRKADVAVNSIFALWDGGADPLLIDTLKNVSKSGLFDVPDVFEPIIARVDSVAAKGDTDDLADQLDNDPNIDAWNKALSAPFSQLEAYVQYISDKSPFGTHQGIKGLQFPRVMVVLDDNEAGGWSFSYDSLLGAKAPSASIDRTRRLFYVTCSRAQSSLAVVLYTKETAKVISHLESMRWFDKDEIIVL